MKKNVLLTIVLVGILLIITGCQGEDYNIDGDMVWVENDVLGRMSVTPHTCAEPYCCQYANVSSYLATQEIDVAFRFDEPISQGEIYRWWNLSHEVDNWTEICGEPYQVDQGNGSLIWSDNCQVINNPYVSWFYDWQRVTQYMNHQEHNDQHYYYSGMVFENEREYLFKFCYFTGFNAEGKWDLLMKRGQDSIADVLESGNYVIIDPWWNNDWNFYIPFNITNGQAGTINNISLYVNVSIESEMMNNFSDLRITDSDDTVLDIDFDFNDSTQVAIWFRDPNMEVGSNQYYLYYGNDGAGWVYDADEVFVDAVFVWHATNATPAIGDTLTVGGTPTYNGASAYDFDENVDYFRDATTTGIPTGTDAVVMISYSTPSALTGESAIMGTGTWAANYDGSGHGMESDADSVIYTRGGTWDITTTHNINSPVAMASSSEDSNANWDFVVYSESDGIFNESAASFTDHPDNQDLTIGDMYMESAGPEFGWDGLIGEIQYYNVDKSLDWLHQMVQNFNSSNLLIGEKVANTAVIISSVDLYPDPATTVDTLNCSATYTTTNANDKVNLNFTWLKDSVANYTYDEWLTNQDGGTDVTIYSPTDVAILLKDENWTCVVYAENSTDSSQNYTLSSSIIISSAAPTFDYGLNWSDYHNVNISLDFNCSDIDLDEINYSILNLTNNFNSNLTINISTGIILYNPVQNETGERLFNVTCTDGVSDTTIELNVTVWNRGPTIPTASPTSGGYYANQINLTCNASIDPESDTIYYQFWNITNQSNPLVLQNSTNTTYLLSSIGNFGWRCRACDTLDPALSYSKCSNYTDNQTIEIYSFGNCTTGNISLSFDYKDEDTGNSIVASLKANLDLDTSGEDQQYLFDLSVAASHSFCLDGRPNTTITWAMLEYANDSYDARNYYFYNALITNVTQNISLYLLPTDLASGITFTVKDESGNLLESYIIYIEKYDVATDAYTLIAMGRTDENGQDVIFLRGGTAETGDVWYRFKVYYQGSLMETTLPKKVITTTQEIVIGESSWLEHSQNVDDVNINLSFNEGSFTFQTTFSTASGLPRNVCMRIEEKRTGGYVYELDETCVSSASGTITYTLPRIIHEYKATAYTYGSAGVLLGIQYWEDQTNLFGGSGILVAIGLIILFSTVGITAGSGVGPIVVIIFSTIAFVLSVTMHLLTIGQAVVSGVVVIAILLIIKMWRRQ